MRVQVLTLTSFFLFVSTLRASNAALETTVSLNGIAHSVVFPESLKSQGAYLTGIVEKSISLAQERLELRLKDSWEFHFTETPIDHNGLTTVIPRNRILVHLEAPEINSSIGIYRHYLLETTVHEIGHALSIQEREGVWKFLSYLFGNSSRPNGLWPRWIHEGIAVWTEEVVGGRPLSGAIDYDKRRYAEYLSRKKTAPIDNRSLDGDWSLGSFRPGQIPYTFGYEMIRSFAQNSGHTPGAFAKESATSLGISFRKTLKHLGTPPEKLLKDVLDEWKDTPLLVENPHIKTHAESGQIKGPFKSHQDLCWIEEGDAESSYYVSCLNKGKPQRISWDKAGQELEASYRIDSKNFLTIVNGSVQLLSSGFHNPALSRKREVRIWDSKEKKDICKFPLERVREIAIDENWIYWIEYNQQYQYSINKAAKNLDCKIHNTETLYRSEIPFARLSSLRIFPEGWSATRSLIESGNFHEEFLSNLPKPDASLSSPHSQWIALTDGSWVAQEYSRNARAPVIFKQQQRHQILLSTGSNGLDVWDNRIFFVQGFWDKESLRSIDISDPREISQEIKANESRSPTIDPIVPVDSKAENYSAWPSVFPSFWYPSAQIQNGNISILGQTFFEDLRGQYSGNAYLGYETLSKQPDAAISVQYKNSNWKIPFRPQIAAYFDPLYVGTLNGEDLIQNRWGLALLAQAPFSVRSWIGSLSIGNELYGSQAFASFDSYRYWVPEISLSLGSLATRSPSFSVYPQSQKSYYAWAKWKSRFLRQIEHQYDAKAGLPALWGMLQLQTQGAFTPRENFPLSFFTWGGYSTIDSPLSVTYLNRGYDPQNQITLKLVRAAADWTVPLISPNLALSWNRLRLSEIDFRLLGESITQEDLYTQDSLGKSFFSTVGAEIDFLGSALHYVKYRLSIGGYRGLDLGGETRYSIILRTGLDI